LSRNIGLCRASIIRVGQRQNDAKSQREGEDGNRNDGDDEFVSDIALHELVFNLCSGFQGKGKIEGAANSFMAFQP